MIFSLADDARDGGDTTAGKQEGEPRREPRPTAKPDARAGVGENPIPSDGGAPPPADREGARRGAGREVGRWVTAAAVGVAVLAGIGAFASFFLVGEYRRADAGYLARLEVQQALAQRIVADAPRAAAGSRRAFDRLRAARTEAEGVLARLRADARGLENQVSHLESEWSTITESIDSMVAAEEPVFAVRELLTDLENLFKEMLAQSDGLLAALRDGGATAAQIHAATVQMALVERAARDTRRILTAGQPPASSTDELGRNGSLQSLVGRIINGLLLGDPAIGVEQVENDDALVRLETLGRLFRRASEALREIVANTLVFVNVRETVDAIAASGERIPEATRGLRFGYRAVATKRLASNELGYLLGGLALASLLVAVAIAGRRRRRRAGDAARAMADLGRVERELEITRARHDHAMLALLDRVEALAKGDLSHRSLAGDEETSTVADALNEAIGTWRDALREIRRVGAEIGAATRQTRHRAVGLGEACHRQANEVSRAKVAVAELAIGMERVVGDAAATERLGDETLGIVGAGLRNARDAVRGLDAVGKTVGETSRQMSQLETGVEGLGGAVEPFDEIAEQAKFLALNTAIRASMEEAHEGGLVALADELQRLSERTTRAARQLRRHLQEVKGATTAALGAVGASATSLEAGGHMADAAGDGLGKIEAACRELRDRLAGRSGRLRQQASETVAATEAMGALRDGSDRLHRESLETVAVISTLIAAADRFERRIAELSLAEEEPVTAAPEPLWTSGAAAESAANVSPLRPPRGHAKTGS